MTALMQRIRGMLARAIIGPIDDNSGIQSAQVDLLADETQDGVEHFQAYGFTSVPHPEAEALVAFVGGTRSHAIIVASGDRRYRLRGLATGDVAIHDDQDQYVLLGRGGIAISTGKTLTIDAQAVTVTCDTATIEADTVNLGGEGGQPVARVGDMVNLATGEIVSGSDTVAAV
ncbi:phage baseplate assembly protein V [Sphingomonas gilva]|nr:phage baseplate assembly protein V [Sphingomonas gilva]